MDRGGPPFSPLTESAHLLTPTDDVSFDASYGTPAGSSTGGSVITTDGNQGGPGSYGSMTGVGAGMPGGGYGSYPQHGYSTSVSSTATAPGYGHDSQGGLQYMAHGARLPTVDMGIDAIINRPVNGPHADAWRGDNGKPM